MESRSFLSFPERQKRWSLFLRPSAGVGKFGGKQSQGRLYEGQVREKQGVRTLRTTPTTKRRKTRCTPNNVSGPQRVHVVRGLRRFRPLYTSAQTTFKTSPSCICTSSRVGVSGRGSGGGTRPENRRSRSCRVSVRRGGTIREPDLE